MSKAFFEVFEDGSQRFRWRLKRLDGTDIAISPEAYANVEVCYAAINFVKEESPTAPIQNLSK
jgi:uncharacterized protein YegP (UPF0339 family)